MPGDDDPVDVVPRFDHRGRVTGYFLKEEVMAKNIRFMDVPGADPSAVMKGDIPQHVTGSTAPGKPVRKPKPIKRSGQFNLKKGRR